jgi:hypothetical protein
VDSLKIAKLHTVGMLPESHLLDRHEQIVRDLLVQRVKLGVEKNNIISYLKRLGVYETLPKTEHNFSLARRQAIPSSRFDDDRDFVIDTMNFSKLSAYHLRMR